MYIYSQAIAVGLCRRLRQFGLFKEEIKFNGYFSIIFFTVIIHFFSWINWKYFMCIDWDTLQDTIGCQRFSKPLFRQVTKSSLTSEVWFAWGSYFKITERFQEAGRCKHRSLGLHQPSLNCNGPTRCYSQQSNKHDLLYRSSVFDQ